MDEAIRKYKQFVDGILARLPCYATAQVRKGAWGSAPGSPLTEKINMLLSRLSESERHTLAEFLHQERIGAMHDLLVYFRDEEYKVYHNGIPLPERPFDYDYFEDFIGRVEGLPWPDEE